MSMKVILPLLAAAGIAVAIVEVLHSEEVPPSVAPSGALPEAPYAEPIAGVGLLEASTENISVGSQATGVIVKIFIHVGDHVKAGDPLFELDGRELRAELGLKKAALRVAAVAVDNAKYDFEVASGLVEKQVSTVNDRDEKRFSLEKAEAAMGQADADLKATETSIDLLTVKAPVTGDILQLKVHVGEFAPASVATQPAVLIGNSSPLNVRAEFDENEAWRFKKQAAAVGYIRGNASVKIPLTFVRTEPYVVPKQSLTGASTERVDTRVLQVIYSLGQSEIPVYAGQQMDVYVDGSR